MGAPGLLVPQISAAALILSAGTQVISSVFSRVKSATYSLNSPQPWPQVSQNSWSYQPFSIMQLAMPKARAPSVPGRGCRCTSARASTVGVTRGSTTTNLVPFFLRSTSLPKRFGSDQAGLSDQMRQLLEAAVGLVPMPPMP